METYRPDPPGSYYADTGNLAGMSRAEDGGTPGGEPIPGPRQDYLDAFDGPPGPPDAGGRWQPLPRTEPPPPPWSERPAEPPVGAPAEAHRPEPADTPRAEGPVEEAPRRTGTPDPIRPHTLGRTVIAVACLAVVLALTVSVAGEVEEGAATGRHAPDAERGGADDPSQGQGGADAQGEADGEPSEASEEEGGGREQLDYDEAMETVFEMDPELAGTGELVPVPGDAPPAFSDAVTELRYRIDVEEGLEVDPELFAEAVHRTLNDPRGWHNNGERSFTRVSSGNHDFVITLASPVTTHEWCAKTNLDTEIDNVSCDSASTERVMINAWRWAQGAETYGDDQIHAYRQMLINHEVGHRIGYDHALCPSEGALAPVMLQQTKYLTTNGVTCRANSWPHPGNG